MYDFHQLTQQPFKIFDAEEDTPGTNEIDENLPLITFVGKQDTGNLFDEVYIPPDNNISEIDSSEISEDRNSIISEQNNLFEFSSLMDRDKDRLSTESNRRQEAIRSKLKKKFRVSCSIGINLAFKMPSGLRIEFTFAHTASSQDIYEYVFACGDVDPPFLLYIFPRTRLPVDGCLCKDILSSGSLIHIQCNSGDFDPISIYEMTDKSFIYIGDQASKLQFQKVFSIAERERQIYMDSLSNKSYGIFQMDRSQIYEDVLMLFNQQLDKVLSTYPFQISFKDELGIDVGGVARDMFSTFFEVMYKKHFEGASLVIPVIHPGIDFNLLKILGIVISLGYLISGVLPNKIPYPCLASILLGKCNVPEEVMIDCFISSLNNHDAGLNLSSSSE